MEAESSSVATSKRKPASHCRLCLKKYRPSESRLKLYSSGKSGQNNPFQQQLLLVGLDLPERKDLSQTLCRKCCTSLRNMLKSFETLEQWKKNIANKQHASTDHSGELSFTCCVCNKSFFRRGELSNHVKTHRAKRELQTFVINPKCKEVLSVYNEKSSASYGTDNLSTLSLVRSESTFRSLLVEGECPLVSTQKEARISHCQLCLQNKDLRCSRFSLYSTAWSGQGLTLQQQLSQVGLDLPALKDVSQSRSICRKCCTKFKKILKSFYTLEQWQKNIADNQPSSADHSVDDQYTCSVYEESFTVRDQISKHMEIHKDKLEQQFALINPKGKELLSVSSDKSSTSHETEDPPILPSGWVEERFPGLHSSESPFTVKIKIEEDV